MLNLFDGDRSAAADALADLMIATASLLQRMYFKLLDFNLLGLKPLVAEGRARYHQELRDQISGRQVYFTDYSIDDLGYPGEGKIGEKHSKMADDKRDFLLQAPVLDRLPVENTTLLMIHQGMPMVFVENYLRTGASPQDNLLETMSDVSSTRMSSQTGLSLCNTLGKSEHKSVDKVNNEVVILKTRSSIDIKRSPSMNDSDEEKTEEKMQSSKDEHDKKIDHPHLKLFGITEDRVIELEKKPVLPTRPDNPEGLQKNLLQSQVISEGLHLVIMVHGYEGCAFDMKLLKNVFCFVAKPHLIFHSATANEGDSTVDIDIQGARLAAEIIELIKFNFKPGELQK